MAPLVKRFNRWREQQQTRRQQAEAQPRVVDASQHGLNPHHIDPRAIQIVQTLQDNGYEAYVVGGGIRDSLVGLNPKDFDIVTNARPEQIQPLFPRSLIIGRRFKIVHVRFGRDVMEVATYRSSKDTMRSRKHRSHGASGMLLRDNVYGHSLKEDVWRRDFTFNALYYDPVANNLIDFTGGLDDIHQRRLRMIGDPEQRFEEDPVRMLRAVRMASKLGFALTDALHEPLVRMRHRLLDVSPDRLFTEVVKMFYGGYGFTLWPMLKDLGLFDLLFPEAARLAKSDPNVELLITQVLYNTDKRYHQNLPLNSGFLMAAFLWPVVCANVQQATGQKRLTSQHGEALEAAMQDALKAQSRVVSFPKRVSETAMAIWSLQVDLLERPAQKLLKLPAHPKFRAAYDFLVVRAQIGEPVWVMAMWWDNFQKLKEPERKERAKKLAERAKKMEQRGGRGDRRRPRRPRREPNGNTRTHA